MRLYKRKGSPHWWVTWNGRNGKRHRRSSGTDDKKLAETLAADWIKQNFMEAHFGKKPELPFADALLRYAKAQKRDSPRHFMDKTRYRLKILADRFDGWDVSDFTYRNVQEFVDAELEAKASGTVLRDVALIKAIINKARREELTDFVPNFPKVKPSKPRTRWLTVEEEARLVEVAAPHLKPLIIMAVETGGRRSELLGLDWREVDIARKRLTFRDTKNGEDRTLRLTQRAEATVRELGPKETGPVFTRAGKPFANVKHSFTTACEKAGIKDFRFHDLRHTFASRLVQAGIPLYEVMHLTGHKSIEMVQRYSHLAPDYQERAIRALDGLWHDSGTANAEYDEGRTLSP